MFLLLEGVAMLLQVFEYRTEHLVHYCILRLELGVW
jgi:hypothetical protein